MYLQELATYFGKEGTDNQHSHPASELEPLKVWPRAQESPSGDHANSWIADLLDDP